MVSLINVKSMTVLLLLKTITEILNVQVTELLTVHVHSGLMNVLELKTVMKLFKKLKDYSLYTILIMMLTSILVITSDMTLYKLLLIVVITILTDKSNHVNSMNVSSQTITIIESNIAQVKIYSTVELIHILVVNVIQLGTVVKLKWLPTPFGLNSNMTMPLLSNT
jgi:hypothetical protein